MRPHIPHLQRRVLAPSHQQPRIGTEGTLVDRCHVSSQRVDEFPVSRVPDFRMVVESRGRYQ